MRFTIPTIAMMIFTSIYSVVDGLFVSNIVGSEAFAGVNLIMPALMMLGSVGFMVGTGGSALVSKTIGEGNKKLANRYFSMLITFYGLSALCFQSSEQKAKWSIFAPHMAELSSALCRFLCCKTAFKVFL